MVTQASHQAQTSKLIAALPGSAPPRISAPTGSGERRQSTVLGYPRPWPYGYLEVVLGVSLATLCNFANNLGQPPLNPQLEAFRWDAPSTQAAE